MNKKIILVVDDEKAIQEILKRHFEEIEDVEVVSAYSGEDGVRTYKTLLEKGEEPALVVMDLNLSGEIADLEDIDLHRKGKDKKMDGVRATQEILKINPKAVIWGYTAWFGTQWSEKLRETGATEIVGRTIPFKEFAHMVNMFLRK